MSYHKKNKLHIVSVVAVIRNNAGKYLVLKRNGREIAYPNKWTFPGGKVENNDTIGETLIKEVKEETGLSLRPGKILLKDKSFIRPDGQTTKVLSYLCIVENDGPVQLANDFTDYKWISYSDLKDLDHVGISEELRKADEIVSLNIALSRLSTISVHADE